MSNFPPVQVAAQPQGPWRFPEQPFPIASMPALTPLPLGQYLAFIVRHREEGRKGEPSGIVKRQ